MTPQLKGTGEKYVYVGRACGRRFFVGLSGGIWFFSRLHEGRRWRSRGLPAGRSSWLDRDYRDRGICQHPGDMLRMPPYCCCCQSI